MIDGKVCNAASDTKSTLRCFICGATSKYFNNLDITKAIFNSAGTSGGDNSLASIPPNEKLKLLSVRHDPFVIHIAKNYFLAYPLPPATVLMVPYWSELRNFGPSHRLPCPPTTAGPLRRSRVKYEESELCKVDFRSW
ncbi:hypothetical protein JTB14_032362 [Gonioctena quinquepunctata]|nr:hypothetical protein JTB14_032362 [Gonioctena quinquepunctata]